MTRLILFLALFVSFQTFAQSSEKYNSDYENFYRAEELYVKEQYAAARKEFHDFMQAYPKPNDPMYIKAAYYEAVSALELYNNDAVDLLLTFNKNYPESIYNREIYFKLGKHYYYKSKYDDALAWFNKLSIDDIDEEDRDEFYFKVGYCYFKEDNYDQARDAFYEVKESDSQYGKPSLYYYSYIAYTRESYQVALDGFLKLEGDEKFGKIAPYYIAQIYYLQGKYDKVTEYASQIKGDNNVMKEGDMNLLIGDAYFRTNQFGQAVPYLEKHYNSSETTRDENYRLGYAYYKSNQCDKAIRMFDQVKREEDSLGQIAFYHIGECYLKEGDKLSARSAFQGASYMDFDPVVSEDALYHYATLSYELDINPYNEAVEAFELYLNRYPNSVRKEDVYQYLVNVYTSTNNYAKALESIEKLPNKDVKLKMAYQIVAFNQGVKRFQEKNYNGAKQSFNLVSKYPIDPELIAAATYWKADADYQENKYDDAINGFKSFIPMSGANDNLKSEARYNIAFAYLMKAYMYEKKSQTQARYTMLEKSNEEFRLYLQSNPPSDRKEAEANLRIGDGFFVLKDNEQAVKFYQNVIALKAGYEDQALYYMAKTYGYMSGKKADRNSTLLKLIEDYPQSKYKVSAIFELAQGYKSTEQYDKALRYYKTIVTDYPTNRLVVDAKINIAHIYFIQGKHTQSEEIYLEVMETYGSDQKVCAKVAEGLKDLYTATGQIDQIEQLARKYSCVEFSADEQENLYYLPAMEIYYDSTLSDNQRYNGAIEKFQKYLEKYPNGNYTVDVKNYMANCYYQLDDIPRAVEIYIDALKAPNNSFTELAASRVTTYLFNELQDYAQAITYYNRLEQVASTPELIFKADIGLMRCYYLTESWQKAAIYAGKVLQNSNLSSDDLLNAHYVRGLSNYNGGDLNDAKPSLSWLTKNTTTARGSEAQFLLADIEYQNGNMVEADEAVAQLLKRKPGYNYWIAKGLILRAKVLMALDDLYNAEQNLKSVLDHYSVPDDGIIDEANIIWDELMQLKNQPKEVDLEEETVIEIDGKQ